MKTCVCAIAKMENHYIREWVEHYKRLGFSLIVVFDNNDEDGEHLSNNSIKIGTTHENARLDHYSCKTIEEFVTNKIKKGWAVSLNESLLAKNMFFGQNEWTQEKEDVYNELIGQGNEIHNTK